MLGCKVGVAFLLLVSFDLVPSVPKVQFKNRMRKIGEDSASRNSVAAAIHCLGTCPYGPTGWTEESERFWCSSSLHPRWHYTDMFLKIDVHTGYIMVPVLLYIYIYYSTYSFVCAGSLGPTSFVVNYHFQDFRCRLKWQCHLIKCHTGGICDSS